MLASIFSINVLQSALELGCIYALVALALFLSYSILNIADLSTDGCFTLGCAVCCQVAVAGHPVLALFAAMAAGVLSGFITAFLQTRLGVESIMAGIIVNTGLYTINLAVMGFSSNMSLVRVDTVFSLGKDLLAFAGGWYQLLLVAAVILIACVLMVRFLGTRLGLSIRATGDNAAMVRASSIDPGYTIMVGLCISGSLVHLGQPDRPVGGAAGPVPEELRHQRRHRHGHHCPGLPHHRRDAAGQALDGAAGGRRGLWQLPVPLHRGGGPAVQRPGRGHEAGLGPHRGGGHLDAGHPPEDRL